MMEIGIAKILTTTGLGFILGLKHSLDADHVAAISTLVSENKSIGKSSLLGAIWGIGHTTALFIVGMIILLFKITIPDMIAVSLEFLVGIILVVLGVSALREFVKKEVHLHKHRHSNIVHAHFHSHKDKKSHFHSHANKTFIVGLIHGLAGSAALMLLVLATISSVIHGIIYIIIFGIGSILGMLIISSVISLPFAITAGRFNNMNKAVKVIAGIISIGLGISIMVKLGFIERLFYLL